MHSLLMRCSCVCFMFRSLGVCVNMLAERRDSQSTITAGDGRLKE